MTFRPRAIHQFHPGSAFGDGVTNGMLFARTLLRELGFASEIYCADVAPELAAELRPMERFEDSPDQVLFLHHSLGHDHEAWVNGLRSRLALVYHNITPAEFFPPGSTLRHYAELGRRQLKEWRPRFAGAIGDSPYNTRELLEAGYAGARTLPLLLDLDRLRAAPWDAALAARLAGAFNMVFVGRIADNKCQHDLIAIFNHLRRMLDRPARLLLVGGVTAPDYAARLERMCADRGLAGSVEMAGKVSEAELHGIYRAADVFVCMSEHEGFGMPLIEAMVHDVPVLAHDSSNVGETLGESGLLFRDKNHRAIAATIKVLAEEPELRRRIVRSQRRNLHRFERPLLMGRLVAFLRAIGVNVDQAPAETAPASAYWRMEGPFDSSYSLAIVNRELARSLERQGMEMALHALDGPGGYSPDPAFLASDPEARRMWERAARGGDAEVVMRNLYPPRVEAMRGQTRVLANYAWEETGFPGEYVAAFNRTLNLITVTSHYVAKILADNGVRVPVAVVGNGVDHLMSVKPKRFRGSLGPDGFRFLHISSCFPRKGVDALLAAWGEAFSADDKATLVIKTFPNPHNDIERQLADLRVRHPGHAPVVLVNEDIPEAELADLYLRCDAFVAPSRAEGFGLPLAEAILFERPVVTTAFGGQTDFCDADTAWLVDFDFAYARTHLGVFDSAWAEPVVADLVRNLRAVFEAPADERQRRVRAAKARLLSSLGWETVARRTVAAVAALDERPAPTDLPRVALVTTWNTRCGIAAYAKALATDIPASRLLVMANRTDERIAADEDNVERCWTSGWDDPLDRLYDSIKAARVDAAVIQFNFGFFDIHAFGRLIRRLAADGVEVFVFFHSTADVVKPERRISLADIGDSLKDARRLFVHGIADLNRLKSVGLIDNVALFPHGVARSETRPAPGSGGKMIASFGYMLPHKGLRQLVEAFFLMREQDPDLRLLMLNALYPVPESQAECAEVERLIAASPHREAVELIVDYLPERRAQELLAGAGVVVFPYQSTQESSSAAVRFGLASGRPVACTPLPIFDDVAGVVHRLPGIRPREIADGLAGLLADDPHRQALAARQADWLAAHDWPVVSRRLWNTIRHFTDMRRAGAAARSEPLELGAAI